jgi:single-strand DNA-binding protein
MQKIILLGYLARDPEMRYTPDGTAVCNFSVADNNQWTGSDGVVHKETTWFRITLWRKQAENAAKYLSQGRQVYIEGRMAVDAETGGPRIWTATDGTPKASYEVTATQIVYLGGGSRAAVEETTEDAGDGDVPF